MLDEDALNVQRYKVIVDWTKWFAWYPINTVDKGWRFFVTVQRRRLKHTIYSDDYAWQYVSLDALKEER